MGDELADRCSVGALATSFALFNSRRAKLSGMVVEWTSDGSSMFVI